MTDKKTYLVSDLANELGVPRTTLNDWLKRFDRYLPSEMSGRRRAYTSAALDVLKTVNKLRNDGLSVGKIDGELEKLFAIRPDEVKSEEKVESAPQEDTPAAGSSELALPALHQEQFDRFIGTMEEFSRVEKSRRRGALYVWLVIMLLAIFSLMTAWYMARLVKLQAVNGVRLNAISKENAAAREAEKAERAADKKVLISQKQAISELRESIISSRDEQQKELRRQLEKSEQVSKNSMNEIQILILSMQNEQKEFRKSLEKRFENELKKRDAALDKAEKARISENAKVRKQQKELDALRKEKEQLARQLEEMKKAASNRETKTVETADAPNAVQK